MALTKPSTVFSGARLLDMWQIGLATNTRTDAIAARVLPASAAVAVGTTLGVVELGPFDGLEVFFFGTDAANETINYLVSLLSQVYDPTTELPTGYWVETPIASGVATLGTTQVSAAQAAAIDGLAENDFIADTITDTLSFTGVELYSPADNTIAVLRVPGLGAERISIQTDLGTAAAAGAIVRRLQGDAQRG